MKHPRFHLLHRTDVDFLQLETNSSNFSCVTRSAQWFSDIFWHVIKLVRLFGETRVRLMSQLGL